MKKIIKGMFLILLVALCQYCKTNNKPSNAAALISDSTIYKTLNGVDSARATQMIETFAKYYDKDTTDKSVSAWYSKDQIKNIYNILVTEESKGADGVRIYFGCDPPSTGSTKLKPSILLVSTKGRIISPPDENKSNHGDYYAHETSTLGTQMGNAIDDDADNVYNQGALLYGPVIPGKDTCLNPSKHYINVDLAYKWAQKRREHNGKNDKSPFNTKSEWFPICFIKALFGTIININNKPDYNGFSGLRIYFGKGFKEKKNGIERDIFILVPTTKTTQGNADYYRCLEDVANSSFCPTQDSVYHFDSNKLHLMIAGYNNGELCPTHCN